MIIPLLLACFPLPVDPLLDLARFGVYKRDQTAECWQMASRFHRQFAEECCLPWEDWVRIETAAEFARAAWDHLDNAALHYEAFEYYYRRGHFELGFAREYQCRRELEQVRQLLGWQDYYRGRMPEPIPCHLFRERP